MTDEDLAGLSPRRRAEAMHAAGLLPPARPELPPARDPRKCHACGYRLDPLLVEMGETLHPLCEPPKQRRKRRR